MSDLILPAPFARFERYVQPAKYNRAILLGVLSFTTAILGIGLLELAGVGESLKLDPIGDELSNFDIIGLIVIGPFLETVISQLAIIWFLRFVKVPLIPAVILSALAFSLSHFPEPEISWNFTLQVLSVFITGLFFLAGPFVVLWERWSAGKAVLYVWLVHAAHNACVVLVLKALTLFGLDLGAE